MKYNKYLLIVLSILILLVFVSSASAADCNKTEVLSIDQSVNPENNNTLALDSSSEISAGSNDNNVLENNNRILQTPNSNEEHHTIYINATANPGGNGSQSNPFQTLNDALTDSSLQNNDIIMIASGTYTGENNTNLTIDKNLNFIKYGSGEAIFDAQELSRIWTVTATSINITSLTFKNGKAYTGGAIYFTNALSNSDINATFINNKAIKDDDRNYGNGGALYFESDGTLTNCNFTDNYAAENAGAVFIKGEGNVDKCNFINNTANSLNWGGGGLFFNTNGTVTNSYFSQNKALERSGGAFYGDISANVKNCTFVNNSAPYGSAITIIRGAGTIENCNFTDNKATAGSGAGVFFQNNGTVINCNFINNTASMDGGAFSSVGNAEIINCNFTNNKALSDIGGAIQINKNRVLEIWCN